MVIAFSNQKGGVGKTTSTLNVGTYLGELGHKVLLVDLDPQANLSAGMGISHDAIAKTVYDALSGETSFQDIIIADTGFGVDLAPSSIALAGAEVELVNTISRESTVKNMLKSVKGKYDYILIDCPPSLGLLTVNALVAARYVIIPVQSEYFALEGLSQLLNTIELVRTKINSQLEILGIAITLYDARTNLAKDVARELSQTFACKVFNTIIPRNIKLSEAPSHGQPINVFDPNSQGAKSYRSLAKEIVTRTK